MGTKPTTRAEQKRGAAPYSAGSSRRDGGGGALTCGYDGSERKTGELRRWWAYLKAWGGWLGFCCSREPSGGFRLGPQARLGPPYPDVQVGRGVLGWMDFQPKTLRVLWSKEINRGAKYMLTNIRNKKHTSTPKQDQQSMF